MGVGNVELGISIGALLLSFWAAHWANVRRLKEAQREFTEMKIKVDLIYEWFQGNVVGRGEPRHRHGGETQ